MGIFNLPNGFSEIKKVDLQKDKKLAVFINTGAIIIMIVFYNIGRAIVPFDFKMEDGNLLLFTLKYLGVLIAIIVYMVGHELIHGIFFKKYSGKKAKYGFTGLYAYAGSDAYFNKHQYIIIGLSPVILFGIVFLLLNIFLPKELFWGVYFIQIVNLSGAAGDIYIAGLMSRLPANILVKDEGVAMTIYFRTL